jgi:hypothetical protein
MRRRGRRYRTRVGGYLCGRPSPPSTPADASFYHARDARKREMADDVGVVVDEAERLVRIIFPPMDELTDEEARAALERALVLRREWEGKGYVVRY